MSRKRLTLPLLFLALAGLAACSLAHDDTDEGAKRLFGRTWVAEVISGQPVAEGVTSTMMIAQDGKVSGEAGCNGYFGSVIIDGGGMSFGNLGSTKMACPEPAMGQENRLLNALDQTRGYRLQGDELTLLNGAGDALVRFSERAVS